MAQLQLPANIISPQDVQATILDVRRYAQWVSYALTKRRTNGADAELAEAPVISPAAAAVVQSWANGKPATQATLDELIAALQAFAAAAPHLTITLAALPPRTLRQSLLAWCRQHVGPDVLVTFTVDSSLLGGMVVRYGSRIFDWSWRRQILAAQDAFPEVLRRV